MLKVISFHDVCVRFFIALTYFNVLRFMLVDYFHLVAPERGVISINLALVTR